MCSDSAHAVPMAHVLYAYYTQQNRTIPFQLLIENIFLCLKIIVDKLWNLLYNGYMKAREPQNKIGGITDDKLKKFNGIKERLGNS